MGPRFCKRGNAAMMRWAGATNQVLQWGHAFVSVETEPALAAISEDGERFNGATLL